MSAFLQPSLFQKSTLVAWVPLGARQVFALFFLVLLLCAPLFAGAQELHADTHDIMRARVLEAGVPQEKVEGFGVVTHSQTVLAEITEGERTGERVSFVNDFGSLEDGDRFFLAHRKFVGGDESYAVFERDRTPVVFFVALLFVAAVLALGGLQGMRALLSLAGSFAVIVFVLIPLLLAGYPPVVTSVVVAAAILASAIFLTHGVSRSSAVAFGGTALSVACTALLATAAVSLAHFTGYASDEAVYLNLSTEGSLDLAGLLLAGIIIGVLGVLDDIAVTQAAVVRELYGAKPGTPRLEVFRAAMRVGKEHAAALVNTLVLAYTGAALPLLLLFSFSEGGVLLILNREVFAVEIIRTLVGSIGLVLTVPITTALAAYFLRGHGAIGGHIHAH